MLILEITSAREGKPTAKNNEKYQPSFSLEFNWPGDRLMETPDMKISRSSKPRTL